MSTAVARRSAIIGRPVDPLCHTLVGTTLAQSGLKERTTLATATLVIGANIPDVDAISYFIGDALAFRRGWTHGVLALAVWPFVLAAAMVFWDRVLRRFNPSRGQPPPDVGELVRLSAIAVLTHPTLDFMNNYGMRWLMPFDDTWFYGDALFIVDPLVWITLALGTVISWRFSRRQRTRAAWTRPARAALACAAAYTLSMLALGQFGRPVARRAIEATGIQLEADPMIAPVPGNPLRKSVVADLGDGYYRSGFLWVPAPRLIPGPEVFPKSDEHPAVGQAMKTPEGRGFLSWSRFPFFLVEEAGDVYRVTLDDVRYAPPDGSSWAARVVLVPKAAVDE
jgi:inner membrane protein